MSEEAKQKKKVYVETTVVSDATALPSKDLILAGRQIVSREWLERADLEYELYSSFLVRRESLKGDADAAARRMAALANMRELQADDRAQKLAVKLLEGKAVPKEYPDDALHIATAALNRMDYLVSWNFKHITNAHTIPLVKRICEENGYVCPEICTPQIRRLGMTTEMRYDEGLEEIWRIKREIASEYPTLEDYFKGMMDYQEELRHQGVKFVQLPPRELEPAMA